jgi:hypothetical protein
LGEIFDKIKNNWICAKTHQNTRVWYLEVGGNIKQRMECEWKKTYCAILVNYFCGEFYIRTICIEKLDVLRSLEHRALPKNTLPIEELMVHSH